MNQKYINLILAALIVVALGVAIFGGKTQTIVNEVRETFAGITGVDSLELDSLIYKAEPNTQRLVTDAARIQLGVASTTASWVNLTGREVQAWVNLGTPVGDSASTSYRVYAFKATTTAGAFSVPTGYDTSADIQLGYAPMLVFNQIYATSTGDGTATTSATAYQNTALTSPIAGSILSILPNEGVVLYIQRDHAEVNQGCVNSGLCATATGTDRGINPFADIYFTSTTTPFEVGR